MMTFSYAPSFLIFRIPCDPKICDILAEEEEEAF